MYLHRTKNGHYTPPCCYFSGELEMVEILWLSFCCNSLQTIADTLERPKALGDIRGVAYIYGMFYRFGLIEVPVKQDEPRSDPTS